MLSDTGFWHMSAKSPPLVYALPASARNLIANDLDSDLALE